MAVEDVKVYVHLGQYNMLEIQDKRAIPIVDIVDKKYY